MGAVFGTDGVRGVANLDVTPELALQLGRAAALVLSTNTAARGPFIVGRDTRLSGPMLEAAIVAGITSAGCDAVTIGIVPTPGIAAVTLRTGAIAGIVISASHNPIEDNGIKVFGSDGFKLPDALEREIEALLAGDAGLRPTHAAIGGAQHRPELCEQYVSTLLEAGTDLRALTIVVDAAYGAAYEIGPRVFETLGARVVALHAEADGGRINVACGTTDMHALAARVRELGAADPAAHVVGVAFDGDADRALFVDESGVPVSGDQIMLLLARERKACGLLAGDTLVATVMSNAGLERALADEGIAMLRTPVGDRYVLEALRAGGYLLGGEQSGHIVDLARNTTGDGPMTAISVLSLIAEKRTTLRELAELTVYPQILVNVRTSRRDVLERDEVQAAIAEVELALAGAGRVLVRPSGTEPLIRVMIEGPDDARIDRLAATIAETIRSAAERDLPAPLA